MEYLRDVVANPSGLDSLNNYMGDLPPKDLLCVLTHSRDSDALSDSNFHVALKRLGGEGFNVQIHRFGHWACGWWESLSVVEGTKEHVEALKIEESLAGYPVLDEEDYMEVAVAYGECCDTCYQWNDDCDCEKS